MYGRFIERIVYSKDTLVLILKCEFSRVFTMCSVCSLRNSHSDCWKLKYPVPLCELWEWVSFSFLVLLPSLVIVLCPALWRSNVSHWLQLSSKANFQGDLSAVSGSHSLWSSLLIGTLLHTFQPPLPHNLDFCLLISMRMQNSLNMSLPWETESVSFPIGTESAYRQKA